MLVRLLEKYGEIIKSWEIIDFDSAGPNYRVRAEILFVDGTEYVNGNETPMFIN